MLMALGMFVFEIPAIVHDELSRRASWRHATNPRVGAREASQFIGVGEETVALSGAAMHELSDGEASIDTLRDMASQGQAWSLVDGTGRVWGAFVILTIDDKHRHLMADGTARRIDFDIALLRVDDTAPADPATAETIA